MVNRIIPTDPLFSQQWFLYNTGQPIFGVPQTGTLNDINVTPVWSDYTGTGVVVAAIDDGFDLTNPDLSPTTKANLAYDFSLNQPGAAPVDASDNHGTPVLGLMTEARNAIGGVGVAYGAQSVAYRGVAENFPAAATRMIADGVDAVNNSYGAVVGSNPMGKTALQPTLEAAFLKLVTEGRGGLGTSIVFAGGNDRSLQFMTSYDPTNASPYEINIAAANFDGTVTDYSTVGPNLLVAAPASSPSSIVTTDRSGALGYNTAGDYTDTSASAFNGTSAAAPIATGVIALMLQANAKLGYRDVQEILADTARSTGAVTSTSSTQDWNGGTHAYSADLGFGNIDALAAVRVAETWTKQSTVANLAKTVLNGTGGTVGAGSTIGFSTTATTGSMIRAQHVTVTVSLTAPDLSNVTLRLLGSTATPTTSLLFDKPAITTPTTSLNYTFDTVADWGATIDPQRSYTLQVGNSSTTGVVTLDSFNVTVMGDAAGPDHTFVYTNDYATQSAASPARQRLSDPGARNDTINAAAVTADSTIDLRGGRAGSLGTAAFTVADGTAVASVYSGDGNDTLYGNAMNNVLGAGRGTNTIDGGGGTDTAMLIGTRAGYTLDLGATGVLVNSNDGQTKNTLTAISSLAFADTTVDVTKANIGQVVAGSGASDFGHAYTGPTAGLAWEFAPITQRSLVVAASSSNIFLRGSAGDDALVAKNGTNVLDGAGGSNFMFGGTGADGGKDTFFSGALLGNGAVSTWDTVGNFHAGDMLTLWGYDTTRDSQSWSENKGAAGYTGTTLTIASVGRPGTEAVTFAGLSSTTTHLVTSTGTIGGVSYLAVQIG